MSKPDPDDPRLHAFDSEKEMFATLADEIVAKHFDRTTGRMAGTMLLALEREAQFFRGARTKRCRFDLTRLMAHDDDQRISRYLSHHAQHPRDHRLAADFVQDLRPRRFHAGTKPRGQDYRGYGRFHLVPQLYSSATLDALG